ncbi:MAG: neutral/alkaline non-lysosomal ceramidase N-terminal domain-containing protein, partial [Candidatus Neomarinimicrobiota bacterium]|nr:neutral/alkaline non-lysosomal ceramidase N-terminal domain-containing protein [Candidatus Neomarinimicrobiota bacterium]
MVFFILSIFGCSEKRETIQAGVSVKNITPPLEINPILGGYGDRMSKPAIGVHDSIYAKAIVFKDDTKTFALVTTDMQSFPPYFKSQLVKEMQEFGWSEKNILLLPSHSHSSIEMMSLHSRNNLNIPQIGIYNNDVFILTIENIKNVILEAQENMQPVTVGTARKQLNSWNRNRRKGTTVIDNDLTITKINRMDQSTLAILINWTAHPTFMGP